MPNADTLGSEIGASNINDISADGRYITFESDASNLVPNDSNDATDIFRQRIS
jgi:hypothetical protein